MPVSTPIRSLLVFLCLLFPCVALRAQQADSVKVFIDSALNVMQYKSVFSGKVNWAKVRDSVQRMTANVRTYEESHAALQYAFNQLGDKHGYLVFGGKSYHNPSFVFDTTRISEDIRAAAKQGAQLYAGSVEGKYAYISIPYFGNQSVTACQAFAQRIQDSLCKFVNSSTKGIIIDLRLNGGGNVFPMIAGLANVLGDGLFGKLLDISGKVTEESVLRQGAINWYDSIPLKVGRNCGSFTAMPVALLLGPVTASAGEDIAIAFTGRPKTVLIGEETGGYVTANDGYYLPGVKNGIVVALGYLQDRKGGIYLDDVKPTIQVIGGDHFFDREKDEKIKASVKWMKKQ